MHEPMTVKMTLAWLEGRFLEFGLDSPRANARMLVSHVTGSSFAELALRADDELSEDELAVLEGLANRRAAGEPVQYITGSAPFRYLELETRPGVFIPRPETEVVVQAALDRIADIGAPRVLDLCCGSGTIAVSIASERADARVTAVDISPDAVSLARSNAAAADVVVRVLQGDLLAALDDDDSFDLVISNPPYIPTAKIATMPAEVTDWEPMLALDGGDDGLDTFRAIIAGLSGRLRPGGWFVCELDEDMVSVASCALGDDGRFVDIAAIHDLAGRSRAVAARLR